MAFIGNNQKQILAGIECSCELCLNQTRQPMPKVAA